MVTAGGSGFLPIVVSEEDNHLHTVSVSSPGRKSSHKSQIVFVDSFARVPILTWDIAESWSSRSMTCRVSAKL
jgi:hypothetical protein